ncbi:MAG TPA: alginate export family protein [Phycisphaerae bacterium]|nr:alginate export family protein [Phycisphaerae bacterium]HRY66776.1 alginate export family protein [Phycisphaerae bacterium]HSA28416.1 alginate export family protein [Phycisphaerae bacterium]
MLACARHSRGGASGGESRDRWVAWLGRFVALSLSCPLTTVTVEGQQGSSAFLNQQRALEDEVRAALDKEMPTDQKFDMDWGGWYSFHLFQFDDGVNSSRTFRRQDIRGWTSASIDQGAHEFYLRGKLLFEDWNHGDSYDGNEDDVVGPNLDRGFYQFDLRKAAKACGGNRLDWDLNVKAGRDLVEFGTGYALSLPMDHVQIKLEAEKVELTSLIGTSIRSVADFDLSRPKYGSMHRNFYGLQAKYLGLDKHQPFFYALWNEDLRGQRAPDFFRNHDYDSYYLGIGSTGELARDLRYGSEWVFEGGRSYMDRWPPTRRNVCAWAFDQSLEYLPHWPLQPRFIGEYMFASGDADRRLSPTDVEGGNTAGRDTGFVGFGYRDTGLAFGPRLSNVHIWRSGAAFKPLEKIECLRDLECGTDWFLYAKNRANAAVSDETANEESGYLGWEMDYFANWRITSDLAWTVRLGTFFPGQAFSDQTTRTFFLTGVTYSF